MRGQFITIDGVDGSGKSTQIDFICNWFESNHIEFIQTREPGGTSIGETIRSQLLDVNTAVSLETETLLMFAARQQHIQDVILPALNDGKWVLSDRFTDATYAYQGAGRGLDIEKIRLLENWVQGEFRPDLTILLDIPVEISYTRISENKDRIENEDISFFSRVREGYLALAKLNPSRYRIISSDQPVEKVSQEIDTVLANFRDKVK
ncbi:dTMP kinase [Neisseriaceae bacterium PsAf]|nr:dTMP kinase [Neisseriaceae bacterium PsAf]MCV2502641.1 dTMP kinase [Neisseriaceae bacterium]